MGKMLISALMLLTFFEALLLKVFGKLDWEWGTVFIPLVINNAINVSNINSAINGGLKIFEKALRGQV
jgi:hypothetical protein